MSKKCKAYSVSKLGLEPADNRKAFYAGWDAALTDIGNPISEQPEPGRAVYEDGDVFERIAAMKKQPAQRKPWVGLTEWEENELWESTDSDWELMKRTEAKLREKNA